MRTLRDYQRDAIAAAWRELEKVDSTLLVLPTGCGKTVIMSGLAAEWAASARPGGVLVLAHRLELLDQAADKFAVELGYRPVVEQGERGYDQASLFGGAVVVGSVQTLVSEKRLGKFADHPFGLVMIDESHHATAGSYRRILDGIRAVSPGVKVIGVTATPKRADDAALGIVFDSVAYHMGIDDAIGGGWLVPIRQEVITVDDIDLSSVGTGKNELGDSDLKASELQDILTQEASLHAMAKPVIELTAGRQSLVFCSGVRHSHDLANMLNRYAGREVAVAVDGTTEKLKREDMVKAYQAGEVRYLCNFGVFTEGFDAPSTSAVVMARPTKSVGLYTQMLGRGTRPLPGVVDGQGAGSAPDRQARIAASSKPCLAVYDFVGNSRHKLVSAVDILGGNYDVEARELARRRVAKRGGDVARELDRAAAELALRREEERRARVRVQQVQITRREVDPFAEVDLSMGPQAGYTRGGASDAQVAFLVNLGVDRMTALSYSKRQASIVIDRMGAKRCTIKQAAVLAKYGLDPAGYNVQTAREAIDAIAARGWKREGVA